MHKKQIAAAPIVRSSPTNMIAPSEEYDCTRSEGGVHPYVPFEDVPVPMLAVLLTVP